MKIISFLFVIIFSALSYAVKPDFCYLPYAAGWGRVAAPRFFYDPNINDCQMFLWGAMEMGSNDNRFETYEECEAVCINA
ncbi:kunitz-type serine protease inhibitor-like [Condylostylus longicornis]|uniref:kunitz-type serine protease inhibitor-like n=1 Tax=Condylostylus longicornis TaxID=2530218 RepID=UPI00244DA7AF|nr:kunitz-type serine protease inhibitor-like [Condylostylus longicornis]